jgi:hypothetical protein
VATCVTSATPMNVLPVSAIPLSAENHRDDSEGTLVQRAQRGDEQAFATLYQLHNKRVYSVCLRMTKDVAEAEDLAQEACFATSIRFGAIRPSPPGCTGLL